MINQKSIAVTLLLLLTGYYNIIAQNITKPNIFGPMGIEVNSLTGNIHYQRNDLFIPGQGLDLNLMFTYNSDKTSWDHGYGYGWTFPYNMLYEIIGTDIIIRRQDGRADQARLRRGVPARLFRTDLQRISGDRAPDAERRGGTGPRRLRP